MKGGLRRLTLCLTAMFLALALPFGAAAKKSEWEPTDAFFVNDFAGVLSSEAKEEIYALGVELQAKTKAQVVAVTVPSLEGEDIRSFGLELARRWGIGEKDKNTGVLLLLAIEERRVSVEVGYGLEGRITDAMTGILLDTYATPSFRNDDYSTGMKDTYRALVNEVYLEFGMEALDSDYVPASQRLEEDGDGYGILPGIAVLMLLIGVALAGRRFHFWPFLFFGGHGPRGGTGGFGGGFRGGGGFGGGFRGGGGSFGGGGGSRGF